MIREKLTAEAAMEQGKQLPFAMVTELSRVVLGRMPIAFDRDELIEVRFFDADTEIRVFAADGAYRACKVQWEDGDKIIEKPYGIQDKNRGSEVRVREYLTFDEDGQAGVCAVCLCGWKE